MACRRENGTVTYNTIVNEHTISEPHQQPRSPEPAEGESEEETSPTKKQKVEEVYNKDPFYCSFLGSMEWTTTNSVSNLSTTMWKPRPTLHVKLLKALMAPGTSNQLEIESIRKKYDKLLKARSVVVLYNLPEHSIPITHSMIVKLKNKRWSTENLTDEVAAAISLACFTPFANKK